MKARLKALLLIVLILQVQIAFSDRLDNKKPFDMIGYLGSDKCAAIDKIFGRTWRLIPVYSYDTKDNYAGFYYVNGRYMLLNENSIRLNGARITEFTIVHELMHWYQYTVRGDKFPWREEYGIDNEGTNTAILLNERVNQGREADMAAYIYWFIVYQVDFNRASWSYEDYFRHFFGIRLSLH